MWRKPRASGRFREPATANGHDTPGARDDGQEPARPASERSVIDLRDGSWSARAQTDPAVAAEMADRARRRAAQIEAAAELRRLRARHWSGQRLVDEAMRPDEWWQHPDADPHAVLGLLPGASIEEAASARRRIAKECHPDRAYDCESDRDLARHRMIASNAAYDRLRRAFLHVG